MRRSGGEGHSDKIRDVRSHSVRVSPDPCSATVNGSSGQNGTGATVMRAPASRSHVMCLGSPV
jgi:hypothetical protein